MTYENGKYNFYVSKTDDDQTLADGILKTTSYKTSIILRPKTSNSRVFSSETIKVSNGKQDDDIKLDHFQFEDDFPEF